MPSLDSFGGESGSSGSGLGRLGPSTFASAGGAVSDLFGAFGDESKQQGDLIEQGIYQEGSELATQNAQYTAMSTAIKEAQLQRQLYQSQSGTEAAVAGAGLAQSGSALNLLADSASQGRLTQAVAQEQGIITEEGYKEQAQALSEQAQAAGVAANAAGTASTGSFISSAIKGAAAVASLVAL